MKKAVNRFIPRTRKLGSSVVKKLDINSIQDFYILLSDPHKAYLPGDKIKGEIFLTLKKNLLNVSIDLSLIGTIKIKNSISTSSFRTKKKTLFNHVIRIYPGLEQENNQTNEDTDDEFDDLKNGLTKGQHVFPFIAQLPKDNIFTSISFEKGSINYKLKGSIGELNNEDETALFTCEKLMSVIKPINVALLPAPKIRTLIVKYPTKKLRKTVSQTSTINSSNISEVSLENGSTNNNTPSPDSPANNPLPNTVDKSRIKLSVEVANLGYLRGELVPVKISLQHIKRVTNVNGIIITLIRICKVDFGPDGPVQSFRKDLSQTIVPLFVDPTNFNAEVNSSVRIPADAFPTIMGNDLISFQYWIEVIVNLSNNKGVTNNFQEKLQDDEDLNVIKTQQNTNYESSTDFFNQSNQQIANNIFNVDKLKRVKNVLTLNTEVIIGTKRKELRKRNHRHIKRTDGISGICESSSTTAQSTPISNNDDDYAQPPPIQYPLSQGSSPSDMNSLTGSTSNYQNIGLATPSPTSRGSALVNVQQQQQQQQPPPIPQFDNLTEKEILRLREHTLLPSEPTYTLQQESSITTLDTHHTQMPTLHEAQDSSTTATNSMLMDQPGISPSSSNEMIDYVPMYEEVDQSASRAAADEDNELYNRSNLASLIQEISVNTRHDHTADL